MKKYRIVKHVDNGSTYYSVQTRLLFFFWETVDTYNGTWEWRLPIRFYSYQSAEEWVEKDKAYYLRKKTRKQNQSKEVIKYT